MREKVKGHTITLGPIDGLDKTQRHDGQRVELLPTKRKVGWGAVTCSIDHEYEHSERNKHKSTMCVC